MEWGDLRFDVIRPMRLRCAEHVALDQVIADEVRGGSRPPTFRLWDWSDSCVVIGSHQSVSNEVDEKQARARGIGIVRRISGGGAMFMESGRSITYSLVVPGELVAGLSFVESYAFLDSWILPALAAIGIEAHYEPLNDIASSEGKIGGGAQRRFVDGTVLHHVTSAYKMAADDMTAVLRVGRPRVMPRGTRSANKRVDPMNRQTRLSHGEVVAHLQREFRARYNTRERDYSTYELLRARELCAEQFETSAWTYRLP